MTRPPPRATRPYTRCPYTTLFRSDPRQPGADPAGRRQDREHLRPQGRIRRRSAGADRRIHGLGAPRRLDGERHALFRQGHGRVRWGHLRLRRGAYVIGRSEEHTSELQSLMRISYAVFCLKKKNKTTTTTATSSITDPNK